MTSSPVVSVVTPSYNQAAYIRRTIESVLSQGVAPLEYLLFDACSNDGTADILREYSHRVSITIERDEGQADAVNKGLRRARADIIGWLNSDDVYYAGALRRVIDTFEANPDVDVIYGEADHIDERDAVIEPYYTEPFDYDRLKEVCFFCQPAVFFRRRVVARHGELRADLHYCLDYEYWLRVCRDRPPLFLREKLAGSRLYRENKTLGNREAFHREILGMLTEKFGRPPARWVYNLAHVLVEQAGLVRATPQENLRFVGELVRTSQRVFAEYGGVPLKERWTMFNWLRAARQGAG